VLPWVPKNVGRAVLVGIFGIGPLRALGNQFAFFVSNASEMYLRKNRPRTTCLYSAASMLLRRASAAAQSLASKPRLAVPLGFFLADGPFISSADGVGEPGENLLE
jgi:hypothetical protein